MSASPPPDSPDPAAVPATEPGADSGSSVRQRRSWLTLLTAFVGGAVVGILLVGLLDVGTPDFASRQATGGAPSPSAPASVEVAAQAQVNAACLRVINEAQDVYGALTGLGQAVDEVDLQALDAIVRRLQPVEPRLARDLGDCQVDVQGAGPTGSASAVVPVPSASATR